MTGRLARWRRLGRGDRRRVTEAAAWLSLAWLMVRLLPFGAYSRVLGRPAGAGSVPVPSTPSCPGGARDVGLALRRASRHLPWHSTCLMEVVAGTIMLRLRGYHHQTFVGAARRDQRDFEFHAWLVAGGVPICGVHEAPRYTVVATFH